MAQEIVKHYLGTVTANIPSYMALPAGSTMDNAAVIYTLKNAQMLK